MTDPKPPYDVALSFMMADIPLARELYQRLRETLSVFFFERKQEELTGRDGLEGFRAPFLTALISVVLYRPPYGEANWTGVEKTAIGEACQARGYRNLFVVMTDPAAKPPAWMPATHIYFSTSLFPVEELVGAIKSKVLELGGKLEPMTAEKRADMHLEEIQYQADRQRFHTTDQGRIAALRELNITFAEAARKCAGAEAKGITVRSGYNDYRCVITNDTVSIVAQWKPAGYPGIEHDILKVEEYETNIALPAGPRLTYFDGEPKPSVRSEYRLEFTRGREVVWTDARDEAHLSSTHLADLLVIQFFALAERVAASRNRVRRHGHH